MRSERNPHPPRFNPLHSPLSTILLVLSFLPPPRCPTGSDARPSSLFKTIEPRKQRHSQLFVLAGHLAASGVENDWNSSLGERSSLAASTIIFTRMMLRIMHPWRGFFCSRIVHSFSLLVIFGRRVITFVGMVIFFFFG